jgi:tetratricopeptide (TPR) repeat protein
MSARLQKLEALIAKNGSDPFAHYARAMELRSLGRADEALEAFAQVRAQFPAYVPNYLLGGQLAAELGRTELARAFLEPGVEAARRAGDEHALSELRTALAALP